jgi:hypothetical protein
MDLTAQNTASEPYADANVPLTALLDTVPADRGAGPAVARVGPPGTSSGI